MTVTFGANFPTMEISIGVASATSGSGEWDAGLFDTATWGPDVVWTDVSSYVRSVNTNGGRQREQDRYTGSATVVFSNRDGRFTPANLSGPYVVAGATQIRPRLPIRVVVFTIGPPKVIFQGFVDDWTDEFDGGGADCVAVATCSDPLSVLAAYNGSEQSAQGSSETSGARIQRIAANAGWTLPLEIDNGVTSMQETTLAQNALSECLLTADSEGGVLYAAGAGALWFEGRNYLIETYRCYTSQATFGGSGIPFRDPVFTYSSDQLYNMINLSRAGGTQQSATDAESRALYGDRPYTRNDLICESDADAEALANLNLAKWSAPEYRVAQITVDPARTAADSVTWATVCGLQIHDRVTYSAYVRSSALTITDDAFVEGVSYSIGPKRFEATINFSSTTAWDAFSTSRWDAGEWDDATFFY